MRIIDAHSHLYAEPGYLDHLLRAMDELGIEKVCLSGLGPLFGFADNRDVKAAMVAHPDRVIGALFVRPGVDGPETIDRGFHEGFRMLKVTVPRVPYDDPSCDPLWEKARHYRMPVLFHTGVVTLETDSRGQRISSWFMHPMRVEPITREFPDLPVIIAHLGIHWNDDAAEVARMRPNGYVDLTGEPGGWRARADATGMQKWLWWPNAFAKVVFGTDVHYTKMGRILQEDRDRLERLGIDAGTRRKVFSENIAHMLGMV